MSDYESIENLRFDYKIWLSMEDGQGLMGDGKWKILKAIEEHGSLKAATKALGITYRRTWGDLKSIEQKLGFEILEKTRGGKDGGATQLTTQGKLLVSAFDAFHAKVDAVMDEAFREFRQNLKDE